MPAVPPEVWPAVRALFERAQPLDPAAREALLAATEAPAAVLEEVRSLLSQEVGGTEGGFLGGHAADGAAVGDRRGPWRLTGRLGAGGMGEVWSAERDDGHFRGEAAVKILKRGMDSAAVLARFAQEQQALARLGHPNIARLMDAGRGPDGLPFFVMERVHGRPLDEACRDLPLRARIELVLQLADAVAHAHRNLLVHRDLKPGNVLVSADGQVKLLDFGIAKALEAGDDGAATQLGGRPFTPQYASPEQVRGEPVGTATDVYSLGVLLYGVLTGQRPYGRQAASAAEAAQAVLEEAPQRPAGLHADLANVLLKALEKPVERRYASVDALAADLRAWLGGYPVAAQPARVAYVLGKFVLRHRWAVLAGTLGGLGLAAGLAAALLQGREVVALGVVGLAGGLGLALVQARQAALARDEARRQLAGVKRIAGELVFRVGDTIAVLPGGAATQEAMLKEIVQSLEGALHQAPDDPDLIVLVASALGRLAHLQANPAFAAAGRAGEAEATVERALALADRVWQQRQGDWRFACQHLVTLIAKAQLLRGRGQPAQGLQVLALAAERSGQALAAALPDEGRAQLLELRANVWVSSAQFHFHSGRPSLEQPAPALAFWDRAEAEFERLYGSPALAAALDRAAAPGDPVAAEWRRHNLANTQAGRGLVHQKLQDWPALEQAMRAAVALREQNLAASPHNITWRQSLMFDRHTLAKALLGTGDAAGALAAVRAARAEAGALLQEAGPESPWGATLRQFDPTYARALQANGLPPEQGVAA